MLISTESQFTDSFNHINSQWALLPRFYACLVQMGATMLGSAFTSVAITGEGRVFYNRDWILSEVSFLKLFAKDEYTSYSVSRAVTLIFWKFYWFPPKAIAGEIRTVCYYLSDCLQGLQYRWAEAGFVLFLWEVFHLRERIHVFCESL